MNTPSDPLPKAIPSRSGETGSLSLANAQLVLPDRVLTGSVTISDGQITAIEEGTHVPDDAVDCHLDWVMPGLVELHTDNLERHIEPRPAVDWPHLPALIAHDAELASTGITTVFDALRVGSVHSSSARYGAYARKMANEILAARAEGCLRISHFLHLRAEICSETLMQEMSEFGPADRVGIVSLMDHTPGQRQFRDMAVLKNYVSKRRGLSDNEFTAHVAHLRELQKHYGDRHEAGAVIEARRYGAALASHDDTTAAQVAQSADKGVTFAEFPTTKEAAEACADKGIAVMMGAPNIIRGASHSGNVSARELAGADLLDIVSSDYVPSALLLSAFYLAEQWQSLPRAIRCVTENPARAAGLADRGRLETGQRGDVIRVSSHAGTPLLRGVWCQGVRVS
ncbi:alpha-D-ribose 1-methylphosphonate 5-triphosphate diphosphatase [uncultured Roseobacter sp.]|uniref:alpha-D-ribose 1-methylphosphonate 5-triphosphate diphosphatase n=1 Tax=uncultured Roseobacter sp. TaxID=114847 RepID=UPI002621CCAE|nr:alpha-D-ribose 1-methylphosphonate 5-triphosphate diphosphatase [uncultured Roseobacter sp.]